MVTESGSMPALEPLPAFLMELLYKDFRASWNGV